MRSFNYKHLHYFWVIAKSGGVAKAGERLHVTPQSISTQIRQLEADIGEPLWRRAGRRLELTETGRLVFEYADQLFTVGEELKEALGHRDGRHRAKALRVGITGAVVKMLTWRLLEPVVSLPDPPTLQCREGRMNELLALLAVHELDLVLSDRPLTHAINVRGYNHLLLDCSATILAAPPIAAPAVAGFPDSLDGLPMLLPGADSAARPQLMRWFDELHLRPRVVGEFDDTALMKAFGQGGAGAFPMPSVVATETCAQYHVQPIGQTDAVRYQIHAISPERRITHPAVRAISEGARRRAAS